MFGRCQVDMLQGLSSGEVFCRGWNYKGHRSSDFSFQHSSFSIILQGISNQNSAVMSSSVRQRAPKSSNDTPAAPSPNARVKSEDRYNPFSLIEIGRIITLLFLISCTVSWFITKKDVFWGYRPPYTKLDYWQAVVVSYAMGRQLTGAFNMQLLTYDHSAARSFTTHTCGIEKIWRHRPDFAALPRYQRHHLRCLEWPPLLWTGWLLCILRRRRWHSCLRNRLFRWRHHVRSAWRRIDVPPRRQPRDR